MLRIRPKPRRQHKREKFDIRFRTIPTDYVQNWPKFIPHPIQIKIYRTCRRMVQTKRLQRWNVIHNKQTFRICQTRVYRLMVIMGEQKNIC